MHLLLYLRCLTSIAKEGRHWEHGEVAGLLLSDDFSEVIKDLGVLFRPNPEDHWRSHRLLAGNLFWVDKQNTLYFFHGGSPNRPELLTEVIGLSKGIRTGNDEFEWQEPTPVVFSDWESHYDYSFEAEFPDEQHCQWRDPFVVFFENQYWMFVTAAAKTESAFKGCIGLAVADSPEGPYKTLPPVAFPVLDSSDDKAGLFYECERSFVIFEQEKWHLFFSVYRRRINPDWLEQLGAQGDGVTDSSLYHYVSDTIDGPYHPASELPIVPGSSQTGLFATNFVNRDNGDIITYGSFDDCNALSFTGESQVVWGKDGPAIMSVPALAPLFRLDGYKVWDAMLITLPIL